MGLTGDDHMVVADRQLHVVACTDPPLAAVINRESGSVRFAWGIHVPFRARRRAARPGLTCTVPASCAALARPAACVFDRFRGVCSAFEQGADAACLACALASLACANATGSVPAGGTPTPLTARLAPGPDNPVPWASASSSAAASALLVKANAARIRAPDQNAQQLRRQFITDPSLLAAGINQVASSTTFEAAPAATARNGSPSREALANTFVPSIDSPPPAPSCGPAQPQTPKEQRLEP